MVPIRGYWPLEKSAQSGADGPLLASWHTFTHDALSNQSEPKFGGASFFAPGSDGGSEFTTGRGLIAPVSMQENGAWAQVWAEGQHLDDKRQWFGLCQLSLHVPGGEVQLLVSVRNVTENGTNFDPVAIHTRFALDFTGDGSGETVTTKSDVLRGLFTLSIDSDGNTARGWFGLEEVLTRSIPTVARPTRIGVTLQVGAYDLVSTASFGNKTVKSVFAHLVVGDGITSTPPGLAARVDAGDGHAGETAVARFQRLTTEEGIRSEVDATQAQIDASPQEMGPQRTETVLSVLNEVAQTDQGILAEIRNAPGLRYVPRGARYNRPYALTLDAAADEISNPLRPTNDDQRVRNDITVTKPGGGEARAFDQPHIDKHGIYDESIQAHPVGDGGLLAIAGWRLHLGTWPPEGFPGKLRTPTIATDLAIAPQLIASWIALEEGDRIAVRNLPSQYPLKDLDLIVEGTTETITAQSWMVELHCSPAGPWTVGVLGSSASGEVAGEPPSKLDTEGSELAAAVGSANTTLSVAVTDGPLWTTDVAEFPFELMIGGEVMRVTAITGAVSPQSFVVTRGINNVLKPHAVGAKVSLANPMVLAL